MGGVAKLWPGQFVQQYEIIQPLDASKRTSKAYLAHDGEREVVLKYQGSYNTRELIALTRMNHPCIVRLEDIISDDHHPRQPVYAVLECIRGVSFEKLCKRKLPECEVLGIGAHVAGALCHVHENGFVYNDMSVANGYRIGREAKVIDFDACLPIDEQGATLRGTPGFRSPQHLENKNLPANDVFGLGATLFALLNDDTPYASWSEISWYGCSSDEYELDCMQTRQPLLHLSDRSAQYLLQSMLAYAAEDRPTMPEAQSVLSKYLN